MNNIKYLDLIGSPIQFKIHSSERYQTVLGGLLTVILTSLVLALTINLLIGLSTNLSPIVNRSSSYMNEAYLNLTKKYPIMMTVVQRGIVHLDNPDSYYTITALAYNGNYTYNGTNRTANLNLIRMDMHKCANDTIHSDFGDHTDDFLSALTTPDLSKVYCFPIGQNNSWLYGIYGQRPLQYLDFSINFCDNATSKVPCKSMADITKTLSTVFLIVSYPDYYFDPNLPDPGIFYINTKAFPISSTFYKRYYIDYKLVQYSTDRGLIFEDMETNYYYQKNSEEKDFNLDVKGVLNTTFSEFTITMFSKVYDTYKRSYKKGPQLLAEIGGVINSLYIMATILNYYIEKRLKEADIFNICCGDNMKEKKEERSRINLRKNDEKANETINRSNNNCINNFSNLINYSNNIVSNELNSVCQGQGQELSENTKSKGRSNESSKVIKNNYVMKKPFDSDASSKIFRFKSVIFDKGESVKSLLDVEYNIIEIIFPCRRKPSQKEKMDLAEKFCDQLFDINFLFGNVLDTQINFKNIFDISKS